MTCRQCLGIEEQFNDRVARRELRSYRRRGPRKTTRVLLDFIDEVRASEWSLLDVGGGIGAIQHEIASSGTGPIAAVDASSAYIETAKQEARRRGYVDRALYILGDFADTGMDTPPADLVTMDRVICCYPHVEELLRAAAQKSDKAVGLVFPRDERYVRVGMWLANWVLRLLRRDFQAFVHPHDLVEKLMGNAGFTLARNSRDILWRVTLFVRSNPRTGGSGA